MQFGVHKMFSCSLLLDVKRVLMGSIFASHKSDFHYFFMFFLHKLPLKIGFT